MKTVKRLGLALIPFLVAACVGFRLPPRMITTPPPYSKWFQKENRIARMDEKDNAQRKEDIIACGVPRERYDADISYIAGKNPDELDAPSLERKQRFIQCMRDKGYVLFEGYQCAHSSDRYSVCR